MSKQKKIISVAAGIIVLVFLLWIYKWHQDTSVITPGETVSWSGKSDLNGQCELTSQVVRLDRIKGSMIDLPVKVPKFEKILSKDQTMKPPPLVEGRRIGCSFNHKYDLTPPPVGSDRKNQTLVGFMVPWPNSSGQVKVFKLGNMRQLIPQIIDGKYRNDDIASGLAVFGQSDTVLMAVDISEGTLTWHPEGAKGWWSWQFSGKVIDIGTGAGRTQPPIATNPDGTPINPDNPRGKPLVGPPPRIEFKRIPGIPVAEPGSPIDLAGKVPPAVPNKPIDAKARKLLAAEAKRRAALAEAQDKIKK